MPPCRVRHSIGTSGKDPRSVRLTDVGSREPVLHARSRERRAGIYQNLPTWTFHDSDISFADVMSGAISIALVHL